MPTSTISVASVSDPPETRRSRRGQVFLVWTVTPAPDDTVPLAESLAAYETTNHWIASLCKAAGNRRVELIWRDSPWLRDIVEARLVEQWP